MAVIKLKNVERFKDRYGKVRYYFRIGKGSRIALKGDPGSDEFNASYAAASGKAKVAGKSEGQTFNALVKLYVKSVAFLSQKPDTQTATLNELERFLVNHGHRLVKQMTVTDVETLMGLKAATPAAANTLLKKLRALMKLALRIGWVASDPTLGVKKFKEGTFHTWNETEIAKFEKRWPLGSFERVAFDLHLYTGQRRGDVNSMRWDDILNGAISVAQEKGDAAANDERLIIPMHANLTASLNLWRNNSFRILTNASGRYYTVESYGNLMADAIDKAGLGARCVLHGLRKAAARRLAEAGCSAKQIQAITGHKSLAEVERYTVAANQGLLAAQAIESLERFRRK